MATIASAYGRIWSAAMLQGYRLLMMLSGGHGYRTGMLSPCRLRCQETG